MQLTLIYLATALPVVLLLGMVYYVDRFREPPRFIIGTFFLGVGLVYPLHLFIIIVEDIIGPVVGIDPGNWGAYQNFFRAAYLEESLKFIFLIYFCARLSEMDEPIDPIIYGAALGLGYAGWENIGYVFNTNYVGELLDTSKMWTTVLVRVGAAFGHMGLGIIMGSFVSMNLFNQTDSFKRRLYIILALMVPVALHGLHNHFIALESFHILAALIIASILILFYQRREQNKKIVEREDRLRISNMDVVISYLATFAFVVLIILISQNK
jgi:RsiW-degrading membrane proteinase PrsW (M82 family)|tara:strand:+ start:335 stop:1138 length:804 start_codon:yes stop_codon:yes gene_type:complete